MKRKRLVREVFLVLNIFVRGLFDQREKKTALVTTLIFYSQPFNAEALKVVTCNFGQTHSAFIFTKNYSEVGKQDDFQRLFMETYRGCRKRRRG